jgi:hypothetical protein
MTKRRNKQRARVAVLEQAHVNPNAKIARNMRREGGAGQKAIERSQWAIARYMLENPTAIYMVESATPSAIANVLTNNRMVQKVLEVFPSGLPEHFSALTANQVDLLASQGGGATIAYSLSLKNPQDQHIKFVSSSLGRDSEHAKFAAFYDEAARQEQKLLYMDDDVGVELVRKKFNEDFTDWRSLSHLLSLLRAGHDAAWQLPMVLVMGSSHHFKYLLEACFPYGVDLEQLGFVPPDAFSSDEVKGSSQPNCTRYLETLKRITPGYVEAHKEIRQALNRKDYTASTHTEHAFSTQAVASYTGVNPGQLSATHASTLRALGHGVARGFSRALPEPVQDVAYYSLLVLYYTVYHAMIASRDDVYNPAESWQQAGIDGAVSVLYMLLFETMLSFLTAGLNKLGNYFSPVAEQVATEQKTQPQVSRSSKKAKKGAACKVAKRSKRVEAEAAQEVAAEPSLAARCAGGGLKLSALAVSPLVYAADIYATGNATPTFFAAAIAGAVAQAATYGVTRGVSNAASAVANCC